MTTKTTRLKIASLLSLLLLSSNAHASSQLQEELKNYRGVRSQGMGGLVTTTGNYAEALFGNPARHSSVDTWKWTILETTVETNYNLLTSSKDLNSVKSASGASTISGATKLIGKTEHARLQLLMGYFNPHFIGDLGFALGVLTNVQTTLLINYTTDVESQTVLDVGPHMGFSHPFFDGALLVGMNAHFVYRVSGEESISALNFLTGSKLSLQNFGKQGFGLDLDLGAFYHLPFEFEALRISTGLSLNSLVKSHYDELTATLVSGVGPRPVNNDRLLNWGLRFDFPDTWILQAPLLAMEIQDIGDTQKSMSIFKRLHFGGEAKLTRVFSLRAGLNQGYPGGGIGIDLPVLKMDLATYGEELAGNSGQNEDRRVMFRLSFEL